jgi:hypothetical protein
LRLLSRSYGHSLLKQYGHESDDFCHRGADIADSQRLTPPEAFAGLATFWAAQSPSASRDTAKSEVIPYEKA